LIFVSLPLGFLLVLYLLVDTGDDESPLFSRQKRELRRQNFEFVETIIGVPRFSIVSTD